jgi:hypothetical protein
MRQHATGWQVSASRVVTKEKYRVFRLAKCSNFSGGKKHQSWADFLKVSFSAGSGFPLPSGISHVAKRSH